VASTWKKENPFGERLVLRDIHQEDTAILLPDFAITGPVNMRYGHHFTATATTEPEKVKALWEQYTELTTAPETAMEQKPSKKKTTRRKKNQKMG
jgi:hypothetical protein